MADESWIVDEETLNQAKEQALSALHAMQPYGGQVLSDEERLTLREIDGQHRQRISLIDGVKNAMGALLAHGYPSPVDTSGLAPFQTKMEAVHEAEGDRLDEMAEHVDADHAAPAKSQDADELEERAAYQHEDDKPAAQER